MILTLLIGHYCNQDPSLPIPATRFSEINFHINLQPNSRYIIRFPYQNSISVSYLSDSKHMPKALLFSKFYIVNILFNQQA